MMTAIQLLTAIIINITDKSNGFLDRKIPEAYHIIISKPDLNRNTELYLTT